METGDRVIYQDETWYFQGQFMSGNGTKDIMMVEISDGEKTVIVPEWELYNHSHETD